MNRFRYTKRCYCTVCKKSPSGFRQQTAQTFRRHADRDVVNAAISGFSSQRVGTVEDNCNMFSDTVFEEDLTFAGQDCVSDEEDSSGSKSYSAVDLEFDNHTDLSYQLEEHLLMDDVERSGQTVLENSQGHPFPFIAAFFALFQLFFTTGRGSATLLRFFNLLLLSFGKSFQFPVTTATLLKELEFDRITSHVERYVTCANCHSLYKCDTLPSAHCTFVRFPNHGHQHHRRPCHTPLFTGNGTARKEFAYSSLVHTLQIFFQRPGFEKKINEWRNRVGIPVNTFYDVYDGAMWKAIPDADDTTLPFVEHSRSLLLTLNVDWFRPFRNSPYSCGAIYLVVNNLPRAERFKKENVIIIGMMPGPKEARKSDMNHYLRPLVDELERLYLGVDMNTHEHAYGTTVRAALFMVACDIPATRKVSGFTGHNSTRACYKCDRSFVVTPGTTQIDYSGFRVDSWRANTGPNNLSAAKVWKLATNRAEQEQLEREYGARWSELHRLVYFDVVRCSTIDPMHNLFLGTTKRMTEKWLEEGYFSAAQLKRMQDAANGVLMPPGYDVITNKIESNFGNMKASEWRSWCLVYSPFLLHGILPNGHFANWMLFVNACRLLTKPSISITELDNAHDLLVRFCQGCERLYSVEFITPKHASAWTFTRHHYGLWSRVRFLHCGKLRIS